jgi:hypothetical protein
MKKLLVLLALIGALTFANASGLWSMIKNSGLENIKSNSYTVEVEGVDIRAYVFDVRAAKSICISVWGGNGYSHQLECKTYKEIGYEGK